jgi:glutaredoxin
MTTQLILYSTSSCHLCEAATAILENSSSLDISWHEIDIAEDDELLAIYGTRIPVLRHTDSGLEINWPFTQHDVSLLINGQLQ